MQVKYFKIYVKLNQCKLRQGGMVESFLWAILEIETTGDVVTNNDGWPPSYLFYNGVFSPG